MWIDMEMVEWLDMFVTTIASIGMTWLAILAGYRGDYEKSTYWILWVIATQLMLIKMGK